MSVSSWTRMCCSIIHPSAKFVWYTFNYLHVLRLLPINLYDLKISHLLSERTAITLILLTDTDNMFWQDKRWSATLCSPRWTEGLYLVPFTSALPLQWILCEPDIAFHQAAWEIFTPLLHDIDAGKLQALPYQTGSRGPPEADELSKKIGYVQTHGYVWASPTLAKF